MNGEILLALERGDGSERVVVYWKTDGQRHFAELARERKSIDSWELVYRITFAPGEVFLLNDAISAACDLAGGVRR